MSSLAPIAISEPATSETEPQYAQSTQGTPKIPKLKLTYFDLPLLAESIRSTFKIGGIEFEDHRAPFQQFLDFKPHLSIGSLLVLTVGDEEAAVISQSNAILLYAGKITGLYLECPREALKVDEAIGGIDDLFQQFSNPKANADATTGKPSITDEIIPRYAGGLDNLDARDTNGPFLVGDQISIADCKLEMIFRRLDFFVLPESAMDAHAHLVAARVAVETKLSKV